MKDIEDVHQRIIHEWDWLDQYIINDSVDSDDYIFMRVLQQKGYILKHNLISPLVKLHFDDNGSFLKLSFHSV